MSRSEIQHPFGINLGEADAADYLGAQLEDAYHDVERRRRDLKRVYENVLSDVVDDQRYQWIAQRNPDPIDALTEAIEKVKNLENIVHTFGYMILGKEGREPVHAWLAALRAEAVRRAVKFSGPLS
jgi:hypothetical protein